MSNRSLNTLERLRAESMNPSQPNRQLIVDAHEEIRILKEEVMRAHGRSVETRLRFEGRWEKLKDASMVALSTLSECRDHHNPESGEGDARELWMRVTGACRVLYDCIREEVDDLHDDNDEPEAEVLAGTGHADGADRPASGRSPTSSEGATGSDV